MKKKREQQEQEKLINNNEEPGTLRQTTIKELIAPSGIDASKIDHLEIISDVKRYARSFFISTLPRMCTFPELFRDLYFFGDINTSLYITPIAESRSQNELNKVINELETERIVAADRGNINREKHGLENIHVINAKAPDRMDNLPVPTHAFIGGSSGNLKEIIEALKVKNPHIRIVINAISMETICEIKEILSAYDVKNEDIVQLQVSRSKQIGHYHLMQAENPVWICSFEF